MFSFPKSVQATQYNALRGETEKESETSSVHDSETHLFLDNGRQRKSYRSWLVSAIPWILTVTFVSLSAFLFFRSPKVLDPGSFSHGYITDFTPARSEVELQQVVFTGGPSYKDDGTQYVPNPGPIDYVGGPNPAVDQAWDDLIVGRYIIITEEEAKATWPDKYKEYYHPFRRGYVAGLDMFHTLHCLNIIRKFFHPDYYPQISYENQKMHTDHCIDQLRQYVMCSGDMTPIPTKFYASKNRNYVDSDVPHTCRNFEKLRNWTTRRFIGGDLEVLPDY